VSNVGATRRVAPTLLDSSQLTQDNIILSDRGQVAEQADAAASKAVGHCAHKGSTPFLPILFKLVLAFIRSADFI
jgi:hypothetical protein